MGKLISGDWFNGYLMGLMVSTLVQLLFTVKILKIFRLIGHFVVKYIKVFNDLRKEPWR
jgi:hypothetical protein